MTTPETVHATPREMGFAEFYADLQALEQAQGEMEQHAADVETLTERLMSDLAGLNIGGD